MKLTKVNLAGEKSQITVSDGLFALPANPQLLSQVIRVYQANARQGTSKTKSRGEVARTKRKIYRQKGTGNARHASRNAPIFVGGGVTHGPRGNQNWTLSLSPRMRRQGLALALTAQVEHSLVLSNSSDLSGKTKDGQAFVTALAADNKKMLIVLESLQTTATKSLRNIPEVLIATAAQLTALEVATADMIILAEEVLPLLEKRIIVAKDQKPTKKRAVAEVSTDADATPAPKKKRVVKKKETA